MGDEESEMTELIWNEDTAGTLSFDGLPTGTLVVVRVCIGGGEWWDVRRIEWDEYSCVANTVSVALFADQDDAMEWAKWKAGLRDKANEKGIA